MLRLREDFGAACDGQTIDNVPFIDFLAALQANGGEGVIEGKPLLSLPFTPTFDKRVRLVGTGQIRWANPNGGLWITMSTLERLSVEGLTFIASDLCSATGLRVTCPVIPSGTHAGPELRHLAFKGYNTSTSAWAKALVVENAWNGRAENISVKGQDDAQPPFNQSVGIEFKSCMAMRFKDPSIYHCQTGMTLSGNPTEGLNISGGEMVGVNRGIVLPYAANFTAGTSIHDLHINAYERCIVAEHVAQMHIHDLLLYKTHISSVYWQGIEVNASDSVVLHDISLRGTPTTTGGNDCITFVNSTRCRMTECDAGDFGSVGAMAILAGTSANCRIVSKAQERGINITGPVNVASGSGNSVEVT